MKLAILAGNRTLPLFFCKEIQQHDSSVELIVFAFEHETNPQIRRYAHRVHWINPAQLGTLIDLLRSEQCTQAVMVGQINPKRLFQSQQAWDPVLKSIMQTTTDFRPHTIFTQIVHRIAQEGVTFLNYHAFVFKHMAQKGPQTAFDFNLQSLALEGMYPLIKSIVNLDVGQTIVVKNKTIVAVEAIEGTDNTILRGYRYAGKGCTIFKVAKDNHDMRFDIPVVGPQTIALLRRIRAAALLVEAGKVLFIDKPTTIALANKYRIPVWGIQFS
jgi:DUF1009 family protein